MGRKLQQALSIARGNSLSFGRHRWFPREMMSEEGAQKFHTDDVSLPRSCQYFRLVVRRGQFPLTNQEHNPDQDQTKVVKRHQYGISVLVSQTSFRGETSGGVAKCWLFSQATLSAVKNTYQTSSLPKGSSERC